MEYYNDILCITGPEFSEITTSENIKKLIQRGRVNRVRRSCYNKPSLIEFQSIPSNYKNKLIEIYGDPREKADVKPFQDSIEPDPKALQFFTTYRLEDGRKLPQKNMQEYCNDAAILNALHKVLAGMTARRAALGGTVKKFWPKALKAVNNLRENYPCSLPKSEKRLHDRYNAYLKDGYDALISKKFCNNNSRKVTERIERLILSLYTMPNKPYSASVHEMYIQFINGEIDVYDQNTGELFDRQDYYKDGKPIEISDSTCWNYINNGVNRILVDSKRTGKLEFNNTHRPYHNRHLPNHSFSKISMDDRDIPHKLHNGKTVKAYYSYDVASGCVIGKAYSRDKDRDLFIDCMRDMFRLIDTNGFDIPGEVEVENHLVNKFKDGLMQAGIVFPFVRWCNPGNSQEKRAEHLNRAKKYSVEKNNHNGIGRFYAKLEANRPKQEYGQEVKKFSFDEIVANDLKDIKEFNNQKHPNQEKYPNQTRWEVLCNNINPDLPKIDKGVLVRFIGDQTQTSIRRQFCQVQGCKYRIEDINILNRLNPNNYTVNAYYLPDAKGLINEIYLYQNDAYIGTAQKIETYNEATIEQTEKDHEAYAQQAKYVSKFDKFVKDGKDKLFKPGIMKPEEFEELENIEVETIDIIYTPDNDTDEDLQEFNDFYSPENVRRRAIEQL